MKTTVKLAMTLFLMCAMSALGGCTSCAKVSCVAPHADLPATVSAGETLTIDVYDLWATCYDTGCGGPNGPLTSVTVEAVTGGNVVATATAPVNSQATAQVSLTIPSDATGMLTIRTSGTVFDLGTVDVVKG